VNGGSVVLYCEGGRSSGGRSARTDVRDPQRPEGEVRIAVIQHVRLPDGMGKKYPMPPVNDGPVTPARPAGAGGPRLGHPQAIQRPRGIGADPAVGESATGHDLRLTR